MLQKEMMASLQNLIEKKDMQIIKEGTITLTLITYS